MYVCVLHWFVFFFLIRLICLFAHVVAPAEKKHEEVKLLLFVCFLIAFVCFLLICWFVVYLSERIVATPTVKQHEEVKLLLLLI